MVTQVSINYFLNDLSETVLFLLLVLQLHQSIQSMASVIARKLATFGFGAVSGSALTHIIKTYIQSPVDEPQVEDVMIETGAPSAAKSSHHRKSSKSWNYQTYTPTHPWDHNWDNRAHHTVAKSEGDQPVKKTKAIRHLLLIRHGQYNLSGDTDQERILTDLGIKQAESTGRRLAELNLPLTYLMSSTMSRAIQTADLIRAHLPSDLKVLPPDAILREGGPYPPEPISRWSPEVRYHDDGARIEAAFRKYFHRPDPSQVFNKIIKLIVNNRCIRIRDNYSNVKLEQKP